MNCCGLVILKKGEQNSRGWFSKLLLLFVVVTIVVATVVTTAVVLVDGQGRRTKQEAEVHDILRSKS